MSVYVRELLIDLADHKLDIEARIDLLCGLEHLHKTGQITTHQIKLINDYCAGYSLVELSHSIPNAGEAICSALALLEEYTRYVDEIVIQYGLRLFPKYAKTVGAFKRKAQVLSNEL